MGFLQQKFKISCGHKSTYVLTKEIIARQNRSPFFSICDTNIIEEHYEKTKPENVVSES